MSVIKIFLVLFSEFSCFTKLVQGSKSWGGTCQVGTLQSPIKLNGPNANKSQHPAFKFDGLDARFYPELENTGYGVQMLVPNNVIKISSGNLDNEYVLYNVQWHWDRSEHDVDNRKCILETHFIFINAKYYSKEDALHKADGFVVVAVLHELVSGVTNYLQKIHQIIWHLTEVNAKILALQDLTIRDMLPSDMENYYIYKGSFTSPPCFQGVTWIVFRDFLEATHHDIDSFRKIKGEDGKQLHHNYRSLQPINNRTIYFHGDINFTHFQHAHSNLSPEQNSASIGLLYFIVAAVRVLSN